MDKLPTDSKLGQIRFAKSAELIVGDFLLIGTRFTIDPAQKVQLRIYPSDVYRTKIKEFTKAGGNHDRIIDACIESFRVNNDWNAMGLAKFAVMWKLTPDPKLDFPVSGGSRYPIREENLLN